MSEEASKLEELYKGQRSVLIMVIGLSGTGKSTSLMNLNPKETLIVNVMGKPLPFQSGFVNYKPGENMLNEAGATAIINQMNQFVNYNYKPEIKNLVIDDGQYIMASEFMAKASVKGYDKFTVMANNIWTILVTASRLRGGLKVIFLTHEENTDNERKMKTLGKLLDDKLTPEGLSTIVLFSGVSANVGGNTYFFQTQSDGRANAKSPMGMFPSLIPNDMDLVVKRVDEYYSGVPLDKSSIKFVEVQKK